MQEDDVSGAKDQVVVVTYDAGTDSFTLNPNPVAIPMGNQLFFALQTVNRGLTEEAIFTDISITNTGLGVGPLNGLKKLFVVKIEDEHLRPGMLLNYSVSCHYHTTPRLAELDPTIVLLPPE